MSNFLDWESGWNNLELSMDKGGEVEWGERGCQEASVVIDDQV